MPERPGPWNILRLLNEIFERLRAVEHLASSPQEATEVIGVEGRNAYTWQSAFTLTPTTGLKFFTESAGRILFIRADRSSGDGASTATIDVLKNGVSIYPSNAMPTVPAGEFLGPEATPDDVMFIKEDYFECSILNTGGGTGPLRVTWNIQDSS